MTAELLKLAQRVEELTDPDRETDALIWAEIDDRDVRWGGHLLLGKSRKPPHDECRIGYIDPRAVNRNFSLSWSQPPIPAYTASLDVATSLVPEGMGWIAGNGRTRPDEMLGGARITSLDGQTIIAESEAVTPALAMTAVALKARALAEKEAPGDLT